MSEKQEGKQNKKIIVNRLNANGKGITLIALVITIIVLIILTGVSIATLTGDNGLLTKAQKGVEENIVAEERDQIGLAYNGAKAEKLGTEITAEQLQEQLSKNQKQTAVDGENILKVTFSDTENSYIIDKQGVITGPLKKLEPGDIASFTIKNNYIDMNGDKATIPEGFQVSDKKGETTINTGLVVINPADSSEFVWVPVENPNEMYGILEDGTKAGKLYDKWTATTSKPLNWTETNDIMSITNASNYREPDIVLNYDNNTTYLSLMNEILGTTFTSSTDFKNYLQNEYSKMIESIKKYKGFYIGRYETSLEGDTPKSIKGAVSATAEDNSQMWYGLYAKQQLYSTNSVKGQMIWVSQWHAMMKWMQNNYIDVSSKTPILGVSKNTGNITGIVETDKLNNIYDLLGNRYEWTSGTISQHSRVLCSGCYNDDYYLTIFNTPRCNSDRV